MLIPQLEDGWCNISSPVVWFFISKDDNRNVLCLRCCDGMHCELFNPMLICRSCGPARCSLRNVMLTEDNLKHCVAEAQR